MTNDGWGSEFKPKPDLPTRPDVNMGWSSSFSIIPARKTTKFADEFLPPEPAKEIGLSEQPFEFDVERTATRVGDLCVYQDELGKWLVTHVPSLLMFMKGVPKGDWTKEQLLTWCKLIQQNWRDYWDILHELTENSELNERQTYAARILRQHCLATPVV